MTVSVACPSCGKSYHVGDESLGSRAKCKNCGATFTLSVSMDDTGKSKSGEAPAGGMPPKDAAVRSAHGKSSAGKSQGHTGEQDPMPKKLGQYVVQRKLGAGAMGVVYLARDPILDRQVAIKVLPAELSRDEERLKRFLREAKSAARLHHTNVAAVHQAGAEGRLAYIAMEYVEGTSLDKAVSENKPMEWRDATRVIRDAAAGLGAAHAIGLVHRDIKPANLIRTKDGVTKVVDFGLARGQQTNTQLTQQGTLLGTPAYMAPEQWTGGEVDGRSDLYSLTCTYYFLLTGRLPFDAPSLPALGYQHRYEAFPDPRQHAPSLPDGICRILMRGSAKEPSQRYQNAEDLVAELEVLLACPNESLSFGSSWAQFAGPAGPDLPPLDDPLGEGLAALQTPAVPAAHPAPAARVKPNAPLCIWLAAGGAAAVLLLLGVMLVFSTKYGTVQISLQGAEAQDVTVTLDGETIAIEGLDEPLELKVGEHELTARSPSFETVTRNFQVKKNETTVVEVAFVPRLAGDAKPKPSPEQPETDAAPGALRFPAIYRIQIDPPEAILAVSSGSASVSGKGAERTVRVPEPDAKTKLTLVATLDGYRTLTQELQPLAGETKDLILHLEAIPEPPPTVAPTPAAPPLAVAPFDAAQAKRYQADWAAYLKLPVEITNSIGMKLTLIPPGEFMMGSDLSAEEIDQRYPGGIVNLYKAEHPRHPVRLTHPFYLGMHEVRVGDFERFAAATGHRTTAETEGSARGFKAETAWDFVAGLSWRNPGFQQDDGHPVTCVSWHDATAFCEWLSRCDGRTYRLPTEAEWEYSCRAGTDTLFPWGDDADDGRGYLNGADLMGSPHSTAWTNRFNFRDGYVATSPVGGFRPNAFALHDMLGNVSEWCADWHAQSFYDTTPLEDPIGPETGSMRVIRGGGWAHAPWHCRSAYRGKYSTDQRNDTLGFRVATTMPNSPAATVQTPPAGPLFPVDGRVSIGACRYKLTELRVNERTTSLQRNPSMAVLKDGRVLVAWESYDQPVGSDCWGRAFSPEGAVLGSEFHLNPHNSSGWEYGPSLGALPDGGFVVAWGAESREVRLQRFDKSLRAAGRDSQVIGVDIWPAVSVLSRGDFVVGLGNATWGAGGRRYRASGAPVGDVFRASTRPLAFGKEHQQIVATAPAADGGFVVTWFTGLENSDVLVRRYDANGAPLGGEFTVNTTKGCGNVFPTVAVNSTNDLIVAWNRRGPGKDSAIVARRFAPDNGPLTDEWVVNQHASGRQDCPNVVVGPGGEYLVSWPHDEGAGQDIYARLYDATDKPLGPSFRVNLFTAGTQSLPRCASRRATAVVGKNLFFAWHGAGPGDEGGVFLTVLNRVD